MNARRWYATLHEGLRASWRLLPLWLAVVMVIAFVRVSDRCSGPGPGRVEDLETAEQAYIYQFGCLGSDPEMLSVGLGSLVMVVVWLAIKGWRL